MGDLQLVLNFITACIFEWGIAMYDADLGDLAGKKEMTPEDRRRLGVMLRKKFGW